MLFCLHAVCGLGDTSMARFSQPLLATGSEPSAAPPTTSEPVDVILLAQGVADALHIRLADPGWVGVLIHARGISQGPVPGSWSITDPVIGAVGPEPDLRSRLRGCQVLEKRWESALLIPGLVNAHTHLDLTHIGPQHPDPAGFAAFAALVRDRRATHPDAIRASVRQGVQLSLAGGVVAVGDIAGAVRGAADLVAAQELGQSPLWGTAFLEFFALGAGEARGRAALLDALRQASHGPSLGIGLGIQPHAPYSVSAGSYRWAIEQAFLRGMPICSHVAESPQEHELIEQGTGPLRTMLEGLSIWTPTQGGTEELGLGKTPLTHVLDAVDETMSEMTLVHCNDLSDRDLQRLVDQARTQPLRVIYCPRSSRYFDAPKSFGPHRYRDLLAAGLPVALGTDSIINLPVGSQRITPWDEARLLMQRDALPAQQALAMMTTHATLAIGMNPRACTLQQGASPLGISVVEVEFPASHAGDPLQQAILQGVPELVLIASKSKTHR